MQYVEKVGSIESFFYSYGDPTVTLPMPVYTPLPNCGGYPVLFNLEMQNGNPVPDAFSLDLANHTFVVT